MLAHDAKAEFMREDVRRATFPVVVPSMRETDGNSSRLKWRSGNWDPHLMFGRARGAIASRFLAVTTPASVSYFS